MYQGANIQSTRYVHVCMYIIFFSSFISAVPGSNNVWKKQMNIGLYSRSITIAYTSDAQIFLNTAVKYFCYKFKLRRMLYKHTPAPDTYDQ